MLVQIREESFNAYQELTKYAASGDFGATSIFIGSMRSNKNIVSKMLIEHYPGMTEKVLYTISQQAQQQYGLDDVLILHRVGEVFPQDHIVLIACWSTRRDAAINASRFLIEQLKSTVPFWKKEWHQNTATWVESNSTAIYDT